VPVTQQIHAPQLVNALGHAAALPALVWNAASLAEAGAAGTARCRAGQSARVVGRHGSCRCEAGS